MGRAVAQAVTRRLGFDPRLSNVGFVVDKVAVRWDFAEQFSSPYRSTNFSRVINRHITDAIQASYRQCR
jgi:hypothetical protein